MSKAYPNIKKMSSRNLQIRLDKFKLEWIRARKGGMRLDSFSALYIGGEIERMEDLLGMRGCDGTKSTKAGDATS